MEISNQILSEITVYMKYAKFIPELNRRETWEELVTRNKKMHIKTYPKLKEEIVCPSSLEANRVSSCDQCFLCDGNSKPVTIIQH